MNHSPLVQKLWNNWLDHNDDQAASELIENYMYLVSFHVERIASHLPESVHKDDLKSYGLMGLYDALTKFETSRNLKFDTYASFRIRGAIIDGLRKEDWLPRSLREKTKRVEQVSRELEQNLQRSPTAQEIALQLNMKTEEVETILKDALFSHVLSIEDKHGNNKEEHIEGIGHSIPDQTAILPDEHVVDEEIKKELVNSIHTLNDNEKMVISLFYNEELTLTEIGVVLGLTTSRISQIHKKAIFKLRSTLRKLEMVQ
ncbi:FliA/WhiG family RNA polymerase sigma factor [Virgibacillus sp. W0430]|uniref:FliA/WhiG family RNA polymerase sigma factor n=1 Tax=Virgibacillus sp. W0430 TaxID=3391580 RepID=UPI003F4533E0